MFVLQVLNINLYNFIATIHVVESIKYHIDIKLLEAVVSIKLLKATISIGSAISSNFS